VWEVLDVIVREGMVQEPSVLRNGAASTTSLGLCSLLLSKILESTLFRHSSDGKIACGFEAAGSWRFPAPASAPHSSLAKIVTRLKPRFVACQPLGHQPVTCLQNAAYPVMCSPMMSVWMSCVPS